MNAKLTQITTLKFYQFVVDHEGKKYHLRVMANEQGKWMEWECFHNEVLLDKEGEEGEEGQIGEDISDYVSINWDELTKDAT